MKSSIYCCKPYLCNLCTNFFLSLPVVWLFVSALGCSPQGKPSLSQITVCCGSRIGSTPSPKDSHTEYAFRG